MVQEIIIPKTVKPTKALTCLIDPQTSDATISLTLEGEDTSFRTGKLIRRSNEISIFMFRPKRLDIQKEKFTDPLKSGDVINVEVVLNGKSKNPTTKSQKVTIE